MKPFKVKCYYCKKWFLYKIRRGRNPLYYVQCSLCLKSLHIDRAKVADGRTVEEKIWYSGDEE